MNILIFCCDAMNLISFLFIVFSLTTAMREYAALGGLEFYDLGKDIIQPSLNPTPKPTPAQIAQYRERYDVNEPQAEAIVSAIQKKKGFSLIQG